MESVTVITVIIGATTFAMLVLLAVLEIKRPKGQMNPRHQGPVRKSRNVVLSRSTDQATLFSLLREKDCDYHTATKALKLLGLVNEDSQAVLKKGISQKYGTDGLIEALGKFWALRWAEIPPAKRDEEIYQAGKSLLDEFGLNPDLLDSLIAVIKQKCLDQVAEPLEAEILAQAEERRQESIKEVVVPFRKNG